MAVVIRTILTVLFAIDSVALIVVIMMQQGKDAGLGAIGGMTSSDTYWSRNKRRSAEGRLITVTRICAVIFVALAVLLNVNF
ncbi:MAG: preprotein translocase subunit SecG [Eubacterium sp.]|nr:preprotein translocase subunit SecG [Eubacterium sp.]